ncbi:MAG: IreB family regulatory phosphoprotein [Oscillospiraceae bacterium]|nr:IreB family regulatory phosphoprotein [Oscillospiraceae bacterium]
MNDKTIKFSISDDKNAVKKQIISDVYNALSEQGYNPINQLVGYILSEDPTYITTHKNARNMIRSIDRDDLLQTLIKEFLNIKE